MKEIDSKKIIDALESDND